MNVVTQSDRDEETLPDPTPGSRPFQLAAQLRAAAAAAWPALLGYAAVRLIGLVALFLWADARNRSFIALLGSRSDASYYVRIAEHGYDMGARLQSDMAFFPLYPALIRAAEPLSPVGSRGTAIVIGWIASLAAAWGLFAIGNHLSGRRVGILLSVVWGIQPHAVVESMAYTEALFTALAAWSLFAVLRRHWLTAGFLCLLAGLTRPTATALIPVVCIAALVAIIKRRDGWRPWVAAIVAPLGWLGYLAWVAAQTGRLDGWFHIQKAGWRSSFDGGAHTIATAHEILGRPSPLNWYVVTAVVLLAIMLLVLCALDRQPWQLLLFSALLLVTTLGAAGYYYAKARFLLPGFPLLLPIAVALAKARPAKMYVVVGTLTLVSAYYGGYLLMLWQSSP